jgi:hypothetical protein
MPRPLPGTSGSFSERKIGSFPVAAGFYAALQSIAEHVHAAPNDKANNVLSIIANNNNQCYLVSIRGRVLSIHSFICTHTYWL